MRRSTFTDQSVTYGAVGATLDADLMKYPPPGYRPSEASVKLGSGDGRFNAASASMLTWGVQRGSGIRVTEVHAGTGMEYHGIAMNPDGTPRADQPERSSEERFGPDGTAYITPGMTATQVIRIGPFELKAPVRVVWVIEEPERVGYALGTLDGHPLSGEESFILERLDDGTVWLSFRQFSRPRPWYWRVIAPLVRRVQRAYTARFLRALHPAGAASA
jgi:uncharacterized protein (UPF0548 family)